VLQYQRFLTSALDDVVLVDEAAALASAASSHTEGTLRDDALGYVLCWLCCAVLCCAVLCCAALLFSALLCAALL
jgi:hypothetical protein